MRVFLIAALTADGFIGRDAAHNSTRWTSSEDAAWFNQRSTQAGVVVMGRSTYDTIGRPLPNRVTIVYSRSATDSLVEDQDQLDKNQVYYTQMKPKELVQKLASLGFSEVAVSGGASIYTQFVQAGLVETLYLTIEPILFGAGVRLFNQPLDLELELIEQQMLSAQTIVLTYRLN
jgi:dihydrofolate reductase